MHLIDLRAELSIRMLDLERAIDLGMPYADIKQIYAEIKELQYNLTLAELEQRDTARPESTDLIAE